MYIVLVFLKGSTRPVEARFAKSKTGGTDVPQNPFAPSFGTPLVLVQVVETLDQLSHWPCADPNSNWAKS